MEWNYNMTRAAGEIAKLFPQHPSRQQEVIVEAVMKDLKKYVKDNQSLTLKVARQTPKTDAEIHLEIEKARIAEKSNSFWKNVVSFGIGAALGFLVSTLVHID